MTNNRNVPLDILRGIVILDMIFVDSIAFLGDDFGIFSHAKWEGITIADLVFPGFVFAMGAAAFFSLKIGQSTKNYVPWLKKIFKRSAILFLFGILFNAVPIFIKYINNFDFTALTEELFYHIRILGVLQRLSLVYFFGSLALKFLRGRHLLTVSFALLFVSSILTHLYSFNTPFAQNDNVNIFLDLYIFSENHILFANPPYEPEGIFGVVASVSSFIFAFYAMKLAVREEYKTLAFFAVAVIFLGGVWSVFDIISKPLWSAPYVLFTTGFYAYLLIFLSLLQRNVKNVTGNPFAAFGRNPIFFYVAANFMLIFLNSVQTENGIPVFVWAYLTSGFSPALFTLIWCVLWYPAALFLYRKNIKLKV